MTPTKPNLLNPMLFATRLVLAMTFVVSACDQASDDDDLDDLDDRAAVEAPVCEGDDESCAALSLVCDPDLEAVAGGIYYPPGWTCADAITHAESTPNSYHYRSACNAQVGSDIADPVGAASVTNCQLDPATGWVLITADLCCAEPPPPACDPDLAASVGGLYYPGWTCVDAIANAESSLGSYHYRNACHNQVGSDITDPAGAASVTDCHIDPGSGQTVVTVDLCCADPVLACDPSEQASVGGLYYPGWTCVDAIANAESSLGSYHYRNACHNQVGSDIATPAAQAVVTDCHVEADSGQTVVTVDLCCG